MKIENIFCDICGKEGALTQKKDARHLVAQSKDEDRIRLQGNTNSVPHFSISYAKHVKNGAIEEIDLCNHCLTEIETATGKAVRELFKKSKKKPNSDHY